MLRRLLTKASIQAPTTLQFGQTTDSATTRSEFVTLAEPGLRDNFWPRTEGQEVMSGSWRRGGDWEYRQNGGVLHVHFINTACWAQTVRAWGM